MENQVNQRVVEFLKFKNISKNRFCDFRNKDRYSIKAWDKDSFGKIYATDIFCQDEW